MPVMGQEGWRPDFIQPRSHPAAKDEAFIHVLASQKAAGGNTRVHLRVPRLKFYFTGTGKIIKIVVTVGCTQHRQSQATCCRP